ncbi:uncharacterized protein PHALS_14776 [Plasmopara halstedii]|uniref:Uncharacterized protein n=1 Tax=Plasmopara halstedii TaxID=4781 RepID=A0A0P1AT47_PLAHL|nr:uncharacterized protein PHALS_14776 [Plasmopara halstedii]CEG44121.1 hypothetical protein PHALS_14776 [Plasmopara halstedii]|eukprot:XP_024580490.1 hypothetical protein PHALS_14776 [Plasmopara halstedii]
MEVMIYQRKDRKFQSVTCTGVTPSRVLQAVVVECTTSFHYDNLYKRIAPSASKTKNRFYLIANFTQGDSEPNDSWFRTSKSKAILTLEVWKGGCREYHPTRPLSTLRIFAHPSREQSISGMCLKLKTILLLC